MNDERACEWEWARSFHLRARLITLPSPQGTIFASYLPWVIQERRGLHLELRTFSKPLEISNTLLETWQTFENFQKRSTLFSTACKITKLVAFRRSITHWHVWSPLDNLTKASILRMCLIICACAHLLTRVTCAYAQEMRLIICAYAHVHTRTACAHA